MVAHGQFVCGHCRAPVAEAAGGLGVGCDWGADGCGQRAGFSCIGYRGSTAGTDDLSLAERVRCGWGGLGQLVPAVAQ